MASMGEKSLSLERKLMEKVKAVILLPLPEPVTTGTEIKKGVSHELLHFQVYSYRLNQGQKGSAAYLEVPVPFNDQHFCPKGETYHCKSS